MINPQIFKAYDIRGIYPQDINEENINQIITAIYVLFTKKVSDERQLSIVLSYDMRLSGESLYKIAKKTLIDLGANVIDAGMLSTPSFYFAVNHYKYDAGIQITASHNPKEYNGVKFVVNSKKGIIKIGKSTGMSEVEQMANSKISYQAKFQGKIEKKTRILQDEVENALQMFDHPQIKKFKIVADPANAMGATYIQALFEKVPADLIKMNFELDGSFPVHQPDPLNFDNLKDLQAKVLAEHADFGIAPDGDGDRLYFIDEKGQVVPATIITALIARLFLEKHPGSTILFDIRYILGSKKIIEENKGKYEITRVGHAFITEALEKTNGIFAGESSGHFYYQATGNAESQVATLVAVLAVLTSENPLSEVVRELQRSFESGEFNFKVKDANKIMGEIKNDYADGQLSEIDGIAISYPNWRFSLRSSNTEPLLRLNVESYDILTMESKRDELTQKITELSKE